LSRRHLSELEIQQALGRGKSVAQLQGGEVREPFGAIVRWLSLREARHGQVVLELHEVADAGRDDFFDVGELPSIHGDDVLEVAFSSLEAALDHAVEQLGASRERFVNESMLGDEYADLRRAR
jgi:hypothetical protein